MKSMALQTPDSTCACQTSPYFLRRCLALSVKLRLTVSLTSFDLELMTEQLYRKFLPTSLG
jgi:hypothetical protein